MAPCYSKTVRPEPGATDRRPPLRTAVHRRPEACYAAGAGSSTRWTTNATCRCSPGSPRPDCPAGASSTCCRASASGRGPRACRSGAPCSASIRCIRCSKAGSSTGRPTARRRRNPNTVALIPAPRTPTGGQSPFLHLYESGVTTLRRRLPGPAGEFPVLDEIGQQGMTDYIAMVNRFGAEGAIGMMDCTFSSWATDRDGWLRGRRPRGARVPGPARLRSRSRAPRSPASPRPWSRPISATTPAIGCCAAASSAASPTRSAPCSGSATCRASPGSPIPRRPSRSSRCSTTTPTRSSRRFRPRAARS